MHDENRNLSLVEIYLIIILWVIRKLVVQILDKRKIEREKKNVRINIEISLWHLLEIFVAYLILPYTLYQTTIQKH